MWDSKTFCIPEAKGLKLKKQQVPHEPFSNPFFSMHVNLQCAPMQMKSMSVTHYTLDQGALEWFGRIIYLSELQHTCTQ